MKRLVFIFCSVFMTLVFGFNLSVCAINNDNLSENYEVQVEDCSDEVLLFLDQKGLLCYDAISVSQNNGITTIHQDVLANRYITYYEDDGNIFVDVFEGNNHDSVEFRFNGEVFVNNVQSHIFDDHIQLLSYAATNYVSTMPNHYQYTAFTYYGNLNGLDVILSEMLKDMTSSVLAANIASVLRIPGTSAPIFSSLALSCIQTAISGSLTASSLKFYANIYKSESIPSGLEYVYKYIPSATITGYNSHISGSEYYKVETLA